MFRGTLEAKALFEKYKSRPILYIFDPDVDGLFSGYLFCMYLETHGLKYQYYINDNRQHGFLLDVKQLRGYLVISADFSIYDEILEEMKQNDIVCINIDHHDIEGELRSWDKGIVINNQYYFEPDDKRYLSGAGVVFEVLREWDYNFDNALNRAIVGLTLLSDARPIESLDAKAYLKKTYYLDTSSGYFKYLIGNTIKSDYSFGIPRMDRNYIDFVFSPRINSMLRFNENYEAVEFILGHGLETSDKRALQKQYTQFIVENSRLDEHDFIYNVFTERKDLNGFYDYLVKNGYYEEDGLNDIYFQGFIEKIVPSNFIGLACTRFKEKGKDTVISLLDNETLLRGSFRGKYDGIDYLGIFRERGTVAFGHKGAFGIHQIDLSNDNLECISDMIGNAEENFQRTFKVIDVTNLSLFQMNRGTPIADKNCYVRDAYRTYIRYIGNNIQVKTKGKNYVEYFIDNTVVKCFNPELDIKECLIMPILEKGYVALYASEVRA